MQSVILEYYPNYQTYLLILIEDAHDLRRNLFILKLAVFLWLNTNYI